TSSARGCAKHSTREARRATRDACRGAGEAPASVEHALPLPQEVGEGGVAEPLRALPSLRLALPAPALGPIRSPLGPGRGGLGAASARVGGRGCALPGAEGDALAIEVDLEDAHLELVADLHHVAGVLDEAVGELGDVDEPVLVDAHVDEGAEGGDVGDH